MARITGQVCFVLPCGLQINRYPSRHSSSVSLRPRLLRV